MNNPPKNRNTLRILQLAVSIGPGIYAVAAHESLLWIPAGFFLLPPLPDASRCEAGGCPAGVGTPAEEAYRDKIKQYKPDNE